MNWLGRGPIEVTLTTAWVGSLWSVGLLAAPALFSVLNQDRPLAGSLVGELFQRQALVGTVCGLVLLVVGLIERRRLTMPGNLILAMLGLLWVRTLLIAPAVAQASANLPAGADSSSWFVWLHGGSMVCYLIECLLGLVLLLRQLDRVQDMETLNRK